jgi:hypothetical protein
MATYSELCSRLQDIIETTLESSQLAMFFTAAEQKIYNTVQLANLRKTTSLTATAGVQYINAPADFLSTYSAAVLLPSGAYAFLLNKDVSYIRESYPSPTSVGTPKHYALFGPQQSNDEALRFLVGPTPDVNYAVELQYFYLPESITVAADGTTWLSQNFDSVLLNAALVEAARFLKSEQDTVQLYISMYNESLALLKQLGDGKQRGDTYRNGQVKVAIQ